MLTSLLYAWSDLKARGRMPFSTINNPAVHLSPVSGPRSRTLAHVAAFGRPWVSHMRSTYRSWRQRFTCISWTSTAPRWKALQRRSSWLLMRLLPLTQPAACCKPCGSQCCGTLQGCSASQNVEARIRPLQEVQGVPGIRMDHPATVCEPCKLERVARLLVFASISSFCLVAWLPMHAFQSLS